MLLFKTNLSRTNSVKLRAMVMTLMQRLVSSHEFKSTSASVRKKIAALVSELKERAAKVDDFSCEAQLMDAGNKLKH